MRLDVLGYGSLLALTDVFTQSIAKLVSTKSLSLGWMVIPTLAYAVDPWIFLKSLSVEGITVMNVVWDMVSNIFITFVGLVIFKEQITVLKGIGIALSFVAVICMTAE